jgi:hypothetical protein
MLEIKPFSVWSQDHSDTPPTEQYRGYSTYLRSSHFKNGTLNEQTENEINEGMYQKAVADGLIAEDAPDEEKETVFRSLTGAEPTDPSFTNAQFLPDYLRSKFDRNSAEYAQAGLVETYLSAKRVNSPLAEQHKASIEPLLANQEMITAARKAAVDRGDMQVVSYTKPDGSKGFHFGADTTRESLSGKVDSLLALGALDATDLKEVNSYLDPLNGGVANNAQAVRADAAFRFLDETIKSDPALKNNFNNAVQKRRRREQVAGMTTGERIFDVAKQAIAIPFEAAANLVVGTGQAVGEAFGAEYAPEEAPASADLTKAKDALRSNGYSDAEIERYVTDYTKHMTGPVFRADNPASGIDTDSLGNVLLAPELINQAVFDKALESAPLNEAQKAQAPEQRKLMLERMTPEYMDLIVGESTEALDAYTKAKASGISDSAFVESWLNDPNNYSGFSERLQQFGLSTVSAVAQPLLGVFALGGSESAAKGLAALNREAGQRQKYSRLFGDEYGLGFQVANTLPQVGADILLSVGTGAAYTAAKTTASTGIKSVLRSAAKQAVADVGEDAALAVSRASTLTGSTSEAFSKMSQGLTKTLGLTEAYAPIAASSFMRSASSTYGQLYDELPEGMSHEEKHKAVLGTSMLSGMSTMLTVVGMGLIGRGGVEDLATGGVRIGGKTVPMDKLTYRQMKMLADETTPVINRLTDKAFQQALRGSMGNAYRNFFNQTLKGGFDESVEEMLDQAIQMKITDAYKNQDTPFHEFANQLWVAGVVGGALGGGMGAGAQLLSRPTENDAIRAASARYDLLSRATERLKASGSPVTASLLEERMNEAAQRLAEERTAKATSDAQALQNAAATPASSTLNPDFGVATEDPDIPRPAYTELLTDLEGEQVMHGHYKGRVVLEEDQAYLELDKPELDANKQQFTRIHLGNAVDVASKHVSRSSKFRVTDAPVGSIPAGTPFYQYGKGVKGRYALPDPAATNLDADFTFHRDENGEIKSVVINTARNFDRPDVVFPRTITAPAELRVLGRIYGFEVSPNTGAASRPTAGTADFRSVRAVAKPAQLEFSYDPVAAKQGKKAAPSWSIGQNKDDQPIISIPRAKQGDKVILLPPTGEQRPGAVQVVYKEDNTVDYLFFPNTLTAGQNQPTAYFETDPERIQQLASLYNLRLSETDGPSEALIDDGHARFAFLDTMAGAQLPPLPVVNPEAGAAPEEAAPAVIPVGEGQMELGLDGDVPDYADRVSKAGMAKAVVAAARRVEELKAKMPASAKADAAALTAAENGVTRARASLLTAQTQLEKATDKTRDAREATVATRLKQLTDAEQKLAAAQQAPSLVMTRAIKEAERRLKDLQDASARTEAGEVIHLLGERLTPEQKIEYSSAVAAAYPVEESSEAIINTILRLDPTSRTRTARRIAQQTYADFTPEQIGGALARAEAMIDFGVARAEDGSVPIEVAREIVSAGETIKSRIAAFQGIAVDEEARRIAKLVEDAGQALLAQYNADVEKANPTPSAPADTTPEETSPEEGVAITVDSFPEVLARFNSLIQEYKEAVLYAEGAAIAEGKSPNARGRAVTKVRIPIQQELRAEANRIINLIRQNDDLEESIRAEFETEVLRTLGRNFDKALSNLLQTKRELVTMRGEKAVKGVVRETGKGFRTKQEKAVFEMLAANGHVVSDLTSTGAMFPDHRAVINDVVYNAFTMSTPDLQEAGDKYYKPSEYIKTKNRMLAERVQELYPEVGYLSPAGAGGYYYVVGKNKFPTVYATGVKGSMRVLKKDGDPKNAADFTYVKGAYAPYVSSNRYTDSTEVSGIFTNNPVAVRAQLAMRMSIAPAPTSFAKGKLNPSIVLNGRQAVGYYMPWDSERTNPFYGDSKPVDPRFTHNSETSDEPQARVRKSRRAAEALFLLGMKEPSRRSVWSTQFSEETNKLYKRTSGKLDLNAGSKGSVDTRLPLTATGMDNTVIGVLKEYTVQFNEFRLAQLLTQYVAKQLVKQVRKGQELSPDMQAYMEAKDLGAISTKPSELKRIVEMYAKGPDGSFAPAASSVNITAFLKDIFSRMTIEEVADHVTTMYPDTTHPEVTGVLMNYAMKLLKSTAVDGAYYAAPTADDTMRRSFNRIANTQAKREQRSFWKEGEQVSFDELFDDELFGMENSNAIQSEFRGDAPPVAQPLKGSVGRAFEAAGFNVDPVWDGVSSIEPIRLPAESEDPIYYTRSELLTDDFRKAVRENPTIASLVKQLALKLDPELAVLSGVELLSKLSAKVYEGVLKGDPTAYQFVANLQSEQTGTGAIGKKLAAHLVLSGWLPPSKIYQAAYVGRSGATAGIRVAGSQITRLGFLSPSEHEVYVGATSDMTTEEILARGARARTASEIEQKNVKDRFTAAYGVNESEAARQNDAFMDAARLAQSTVMSLNRERYQAMAEASVAQRRVEGLRERLVLLAGSDTFTNAAEAIQAAEANKQNVLRSLRKESADLYGRARKLDKQIKEASESGATLPRLLQRRKEFSAMLAGTRKIPKNSNAEDVAARISGLDQVILRVEAMSHPEKMASMRAEARSLRAEGRTKANQVSEFKNMDTRSVLLRTVQELSEFNKKAVMSELAVNMLTKEAKEVLLLARTRPYQLLADLAKNDPDYLKAKAKISPLTSEERGILQRAAVEKLDAVRSNENLSKAHSALGKLLREAGYNVRTTQRQQGATEDLFVVPDAPVIPPPPAGVTEFISPSLGVPAEGVVFQSPVIVRPEWETREKGFMWDRREVTHSVDEDGFISARVVYTYPSGETSEETLRGAKASDILVKREVRAEGEQTVIEYTYFDGSTESEIMDGLPSTGIEDSDFTLPPTDTNPNFRSEARTLGVQRARTAEAAEREAALARAAQVDQEQPADTEQPAEQAEEQQEPYFNQRQAAALSNPENFRPQLGRVEGELTGGLTYDEWQFVYDYYTQEREDAIQRENPEAFAPRLGRIDTEALAKRLKKNDQVTSRNGLFFSAGVFTKQTQAEIVAANKAEASRLGLVNGDASSVVTALRNIAKSGGVIQKAVANMLLANGDIVAGTKFVMTELNSSEAGFYSPEDNTVVINLDGTNGRGLADVLLHEYTHAGTIELLTRPRTAAQRDAIQRLTALRNLTSQIAAERGIDSAVFRAGLANNAEFISYALTAPEFQSILVNMSPPSQRSVWRRILDTIADFFGVSREQVNALDEILNFATMAFTTPNTFGTTSTLQSARDEDRRADEMNHDVMIAQSNRFTTAFDVREPSTPSVEEQQLATQGDLVFDTIGAARSALPQGVELVEDQQLEGIAGFSRANPTQIVVNPDYLAQAVRGLPAHRAAAVVRSTIDEEVAHMASDAVFSEADYADIAEMLGNSGLNLVAHEYYSLKYPSFAERSAAIRADRDSGILSDVTLASEWTRMQVSRMATGTTRERDLDMILDNKSLVDKLITALLRFVETLRERFALSPTASTAAKISQASRMMRRLQNDGAIPAPESSPEGEMGDTTYLLAALSNQTVEGQEDRTSFAAPIAAIDPDKKSFIERFWDKLGERGRIYNMPTALREVYNNRAGVLSTAQYDIQLFNKKFSKLRDSALADGIPMEDLMVVLGTTEPIIKTPVRAKIASDLRAFGRTLSPQDPAREDKMREKENELYQQAAHEFAADFRLKQEEMEKRLRSRGHSEVVDLMVEFRKQMNKQKTIVNWDSTNDVYLTRHYRYYDTPGWHMAVRNGTVFTDDTGTEVDFGARRLVAARSLYMEEAMADLSREGIKPTQDLLDQRVLVKLDEHLDSLDKMHAEEYSESMATSIRQDPNLLKKKNEVDASLRGLLGEVKDPLEVAVRTMHSLSRMAANKTFYENFEKIAIKQGLASYTPQDGMVLLFPSRQSDRYGTLAGLHVRNDIAAALREELQLQLGQGEANATKAISGLTKGFATFSGLSITAKTALGVGYWTRNIIGGGVLSITQGLSPLSRDSIASFKAAFKGNFLGAESDENQREVIRRLTELQILRDDSQGRIITDMMRGFMTNSDQALDEALQMILKSQATGSMAEIKSVWSKLFSVPLEKVPAAAATLNNFVDSYFKANAYFQELRFLQNKFGETHSAAELEQRAAHKVKLTFPTHSQTLDITRAFNRSPWAQLFMPFLRYKTEIIRTMINTPLLAASEMKNGEFSRGLRRLTGYSTVMIGGASILGHTISMIFSLLGDDDEEKRKLTEEEQEQIRMGLPKWQRLHALHMTKIGGKIQVVDMNYIMPHSIVTGIFSIAMNGAVSGNGVSGRDVAAFIKSELLGANIAATAVNEVLSNRDDFGREIYSSSDNALEVFRKSMTHLGAGTLLPASIDKGRKIFRKGEKNRLELILGEFTGTRPQLHELDTVLDRGMRTVKEGIDAAVSERSPFTSGKYLDTAEIPDIFDRQQRMLNANQKRLSDLLRVMQSLGVEESTIFEKSKDTQISKQTIALAMDGQQLRYTPNAAVYQKMDANIKALGEEASADPRFQALIDYAEKQPEIYDVSSY